MYTKRLPRCDVMAELLTDFFVSSKKIFALSGMPSSCCVRVPAPLIPEVALVELPPINLKTCTTVRTQRHRNSVLEEEEARSGAPAEAARRCAVGAVGTRLPQLLCLLRGKDGGGSARPTIR